MILHYMNMEIKKAYKKWIKKKGCLEVRRKRVHIKMRRMFRNIIIKMDYKFILSLTLLIVIFLSLSVQVYAKEETYKIEFDANGGTFGYDEYGKTISRKEFDIKIGESINLSGYEPTREGYKFNGWKKSTSTDNTYYSSGVSTPDSDTTYIAGWKKICTVLFDANGGKFGQNIDGYVTSFKQEYTEGARLGCLLKPVKQGYSFCGYKDTKTGKFYEVETFDISFWLNINVYSDMILIAQWSKNEKGIGHISFDGKMLYDENRVKYYITEKVSIIQLKKNTLLADKKSQGKYKITKIKRKNGKIIGGTISYIGPYNMNSKSINIKDKVKIASVMFSITEINSYAFINCKNLTKASIGVNITKIWANAFTGCKKLRSINVKTTKLKSIGSKAFKDISSKAKFKIPKKLKKTQTIKYKKMIKKAGAPNKVKIK